MAERKKRFSGLYWQQFALTAGMVMLTLLLLGVSFFALSYNYNFTERRDELQERAGLIAQVSVDYLLGLTDNREYLDTPLAEGIDIRPEHRLVKVRLTRPDVCNSMSSILSMIGDYGINMEEMRLLEINEETSTVTFELTIRGNLLEVPMRKLMFQLSKECSTFRILESF